jgi:hypothetical protein
MSKSANPVTSQAIPAKGHSRAEPRLRPCPAQVPAFALACAPGVARDAGAAASSDADAALFDLLAKWRVAEREHDRLWRDLDRMEGERRRAPKPQELLRRREDAKFFMLPVGDSFTEEWIADYAVVMGRARASQEPFCKALVARFDEIQRAYREWSTAEENSRAAAGLPEIRRACDSASTKAVELRASLLAMNARTVPGLLAKLAVISSVLGADALDGECDDILAQPHVTVDDLLTGVARDCARLSAAAAAGARS